jgi:phage-related protein
MKFVLTWPTLFCSPRTAKNTQMRSRFQGFGVAGILEFVDDYDGDDYRAVYTVKYEEAVYVLHAFQKKSKSGSLHQNSLWS